MNGLLRSYTVDTPGGRFVIYPGSLAVDTASHKPLFWYYAPEGWTGKPQSEGFYSSESAEEACWESIRK